MQNIQVKGPKKQGGPTGYSTKELKISISSMIPAL